MGKVPERYSGADEGHAPACEAMLRERLRTLAFELTVAESRERSRIARDLHDDIDQLLAVARFKVAELRAGSTQDQGAHLEPPPKSAARCPPRRCRSRCWLC